MDKKYSNPDVQAFMDKIEKEQQEIQKEKEESRNKHIKNSKWVTVFIFGAIALFAWVVFSVIALLFASWWWKSLIVSAFLFVVWLFIGNIVNDYQENKL